MAKKAKKEMPVEKPVRVKATLNDKIQKVILNYLKKFKDVDVYEEREEIAKLISKIDEKVNDEKARQKKDKLIFKKLAKFNEEDIRLYLANING